MNPKKIKYQWYCEKTNKATFFQFPCEGCTRLCEHLIRTSPYRGISRELREKIYKRDNYKCVNCGVKNWKMTIDHLLPIKKGGTNDEWNLATMCEKCNGEKADLIIEKYIKLSEKLKEMKITTKFEIGKAYEHTSGMQMFICGMADTVYHGVCFIAEEGWNREKLQQRINQANVNEEKLPSDFDRKGLVPISMKLDATVNWSEIPKGYFIENNTTL